MLDQRFRPRQAAGLNLDEPGPALE